LLAECPLDGMVAWRDRQATNMPIDARISAYLVVNVDGPVVATACMFRYFSGGFMSASAVDELWSFSLEFYARPGVSECLIDLQDRFGADANLLLFCCWCGVSGRPPVDEPQLREAMAQTGVWQSEIVQRLRSLRRDMKAGVDGVPLSDSNSVREEIKRLEFKCERIEQVRLASLAHAVSEVRDIASIRIALEAYLGLLGVENKTITCEPMEQLITVCGQWDE
jgi:uncharacterized protein (TIGR02444 family)